MFWFIVDELKILNKMSDLCHTQPDWNMSVEIKSSPLQKKTNWVWCRKGWTNGYRLPTDLVMKTWLTKTYYTSMLIHFIMVKIQISIELFKLYQKRESSKNHLATLNFVKYTWKQKMKIEKTSLRGSFKIHCIDLTWSDKQIQLEESWGLVIYKP